MHTVEIHGFRGGIGNAAVRGGARLCGRGFVQLTGRTNDRRYGPRLSPVVDLEAHAELRRYPDDRGHEAWPSTC